MSYPDRETLNRAIGAGEVEAPEHEHFMLCPNCGQAFDMRKLGDVFYHDEPGHDPLPVQ